MKQLLLGALGLAAMATSASAADLAARPVYKAPPPVAPVFNWTGFYAGGELGGKWGQTNWTTTSTSDFPGTIVDASFRRNYDPSGLRAGGYAGYNWQITNWVVGLEGSGAWTNSTASAAGIPGCTILCFPLAPGPGVDVASVKMGWDASARARAGYLVTPGVLFYGTAGLAWQAIQASGFCQHSATDPVCSVAAGDPFDTQTNSKVLTGWTLGGGVEARIYGNWLLRGEYRYSNFGTFNGVLPFNSSGAPPGTDFIRYNLSVNTHIVTVGLAYKFDWSGPVVARY